MKGTIEDNLSYKLKERIENHRNSFIALMLGRYYEMLPLTIGYENIKGLGLNPLMIENYLRQGYGIAIGETKLKTKTNPDGIRVLGIVRTNFNQSNNVYMYNYKRLNKKDIQFLIHEKIMLDKYDEMTYFDGYTTGNFVVLRNKPLAYISDYEVIRHYVEEMAEISLSRFSLSMQAKINTIIRGEVGSVDSEQIASDMYNGNPYILTSKRFDPEENIITIDNAGVVNAFPELKREYQNKLAELNAMLGLDSLGVDKESGVSEAEANSNKSFQKGNENVYLLARNEPLKHLNEKYNLKIKAEYNDSMVKELSSIEKLEMLDKIKGGGD